MFPKDGQSYITPQNAGAPNALWVRARLAEPHESTHRPHPRTESCTVCKRQHRRGVRVGTGNSSLPWRRASSLVARTPAVRPNGQREAERRPLADVTLDPDPSSVQLFCFRRHLGRPGGTPRQRAITRYLTGLRPLSVSSAGSTTYRLRLGGEVPVKSGAPPPLQRDPTAKGGGDASCPRARCQRRWL
jgi:hypothetical protein